MSETAIEILTRLKKKMSKEKSIYSRNRLHGVNELYKERANDQWALCAFVIALLDQEIKKLEKGE